MRDDVIGAFGDTALTGKPVGDDLREGKPTPLLARAVGPSRRRRSGPCSISSGSPASPTTDIARIQQVITDTGALAELEQRIDALAAEAVAAIERIELAPPATAELVALAEYVVARTT